MVIVQNKIWLYFELPKLLKPHSKVNLIKNPYPDLSAEFKNMMIALEKGRKDKAKWEKKERC